MGFKAQVIVIEFCVGELPEKPVTAYKRVLLVIYCDLADEPTVLEDTTTKL